MKISRRSALAGVFAPFTEPLLERLRAAGGGAIRDMDVFRVAVNRRGNWVLVRLRTTEGLTGVGDASHGRNDQRTIALLDQYFGSLRGRGLHSVEVFRKDLLAGAAKESWSGAAAFSALEMAMWDLIGKALGTPCYNLFGGKIRGRIRNYANINRSTDPRTPNGFATQAGRAVQAGFDAVKMAPFDEIKPNMPAVELEAAIQHGVACIEAVRKTIGPKAALLVDVHAKVDTKRAIALAQRLAPLNLYWYEEAVADLQGLAEVNRAVPMDTAGGEHRFSIRDFQPYIQARCVDILMPDVKLCGGMLEMKKIAAMGEAAGLRVAPHGPASPIGNVAAAHVCATLPNFDILETAFGEVPWRAELVEPAERYDNGHLVLTERPGLGINLNEVTARRVAAA